MSLTTLFAGPASASAGSSADSFSLGLSSNPTAMLFSRGDIDPNIGGAANGFRAPELLNCGGGVVLAFCEPHYDPHFDYSGFAVWYRRSTDYGRSFGRVFTLYQTPNFDTTSTGKHVNFLAAGYHSVAGRVFVHYEVNNGNPTATGNLNSGNTVKKQYGIMSSDKGLTWYKHDGSTLVADSGATLDTLAELQVLGTDITATTMVIGSAPTGHTFGKVALTGVSVAAGVFTSGSAHKLVAGMKVRIAGCTDATANGDWIINTTPLSTTFTLVGGAAATGTGATVDLMWGFQAGAGHMLELASGRLLVPLAHRWTVTVAGTSWCHCVVCDNPSATPPTFSLLTDGNLGGMDDTDGAGGPAITGVNGNQDGNEWDIVQLADNSLYGTIRRVNTSENERYKSTSSDNGNTWSTMASETANGLTGPSTKGSILYHSAGKFAVQSWVAQPTLGSRSHLTLAISNANAAISTWATKRVLNYGFAGYSSMCEPSSGTFLIAYETGFNATDTYLGCIGLARISPSWIQQGNAANYAHHVFNDDISPLNALAIPSLNSYGPYHHDHGTGNVRIKAGISSATRGTYVVSGGAARGGIPYIICPGGLYSVVPAASESMTWEFEIPAGYSFAANEVIFASCKSGVGVIIYIDSSGRFAAQFESAGFRVNGHGSATGGVAGACTIAVRRNAGVMQFFRNGVQDGTDTTDTGFAQTLVNGTDPATAHKAALFGFYDETYTVKVPPTTGDTLQTAANSAALIQWRCSRSVVGTGSMLVAGSAKESVSLVLPSGSTGLRSFTAGDLPLVSSLPDVSNVKLWLFPTFRRGYEERWGVNREGSHQYPGLNGDGAFTSDDISQNRWQLQGSDSATIGTPGSYRVESLGARTDWGWHRNFSKSVLDASNIYHPQFIKNSSGVVTPNFEFMWGVNPAPRFAVLCKLRVSTVVAGAALMDNMSISAPAASKGGVSVWIDSSNVPQMFVMSSAVDIVLATHVNGYTGGNPVLTNGSVFFCAWVMNGAGSKMDFWKAPLDGNGTVTLVAGTHKKSSVDSIATNGTTNPSTADFRIGVDVGVAFNFFGDIGDFVIIDNTSTAMTTAELQKWCDLLALY